ncbi:glycosyl hydrolase family 8 [Sphingomonas sp.]|uniref:glycosyl hydrolase family 8 n=1 Tax=Sphingomonas sp. TaxID=28214 RepID=UPI003B3B09F7
MGRSGAFSHERRIDRNIGAAPRPSASWDQFKAAFVQPDGRVIDTGNGGISHTESQGYGMVLAEAAGDRETFDAIHGWTERTLARSEDALFSWRYVPTDPDPVADRNNATDGDILIAWALTRAGARWGDRRYKTRAAAIRKSIHDLMVRPMGDHVFLLPGTSGFENPGRLTLNPSYYIWPALSLFQQVDGAKMWGPVIAGGEALLRGARFGPLRLPTDWVDVAAPNDFTPAFGRPPLFGFDAIRVPLYLMMDGRMDAARELSGFWRSYQSRGAPIPATVNVVTGEVAPYALSDGAMAVANRLLDVPAAPKAPMSDYYSAVLQELCSMV